VPFISTILIIGIVDIFIFYYANIANNAESCDKKVILMKDLTHLYGIKN
jgi:hypothetical protein